MGEREKRRRCADKSSLCPHSRVTLAGKASASTHGAGRTTQMPAITCARPMVRRAMSAAALATLLCIGQAKALTNEDIFNYQGPDRKQVLIEGARKEGQVVLYSA